MHQQTVITLISKHVSGNITAAEEQELMQWLKNVEEQEFSEMMNAARQHLPPEYALASPLTDEFAQRLEQRIDDMEAKEQDPYVYEIRRVHRIHFLRTAWFRYAAAIIILFGVSTYIFINNQEEKPSVTQTNPVPVKNDVAPGGNRATLTLADGSTINLDQAAKGELARENNATIIKTGDGQIKYDADVKLGDKILFNTMATPRGGQFQLTLPDGSQVWLNAESSITYPTAFAEKERKVTITGEAYFEIAKDKTKPFIVAVSPAGGNDPLRRTISPGGRNDSQKRTISPAGGNDSQKRTISPAGGGVREANGGGLEIEVLGTHFNVNTYKEESTKNITLIEGSVRLTSHASRLSNVHTLTLTPGQQGQLDPRNNKLSLAVNPDIEQVMAWKNGIFNFNEMSMERAMQQLARWYDVEIVYEKGIPQQELFGEIDRNITLNDVLAGLQGIVATYRLEGRKVHVTALKK